MSLDDAVKSASRTFVARPVSVLPFYVAGLAVPVIARVFPFLGLFLAYLALQGSGRLDALRDVIEPVAPINVDDVGDISVTDDPAPGERAIDGQALEEALLDLLTPTVIAILVATAIVGIAVFVAFQAVVGAGRYHAVFAVLRGEPATRAGVEGVFSRTGTFAALLLVEFLAYVLAIGIPIAWIVVGLVVFDTPVLVIPAILALLGAIPLLIAFRLVLAFARPAVAVEDLGTADALRHGYRHVRANLVQSIGYGILAVGLTGVGNTVGTAFSQAGAATAATLIPLVLVFPLLDLVKTTLYARDRDVDLSPPAAPEGDKLPRLRAAARSGVAEMGSFLRRHPLAHVVSTALFAGGLWVGVWAGRQVDDLFLMSIEERLAGANPLVLFVHFATNNWTVAAGQSISGFVAGIPTAVSLLFNGTNIGFVYQLETEREVLLAFLVPHGILEIPALLISGALGLHLGRVGLQYVRGAADRDRLATAMDDAFQVLVGLAVLLVAAALLEGFVSPFYWRLLGI